MSTTRRAARERALALLYEADVRDVAADAVLDGLPVPPDPYTATILTGVASHATEIDDLLTRFSRGWSLGRMPAVDRAVLRLAVGELMTCPDVPSGVAISEGVALASAYSTDESGRFVNGLLARIAREVRGEGDVRSSDEEPAPRPDDG